MSLPPIPAATTEARASQQVLDDHLAETVPWKVSLRLLPFLFLLYGLNILDRVNVGFAKLKMMDDLDMDPGVFGMGFGIFFIGYFIFEIPSNLILKRTGARRWIARIMISWGIISASMMFVTTPWNFYLLRFLLGVAEAGFFPGIILYLSYWFPARERARAVSRFMTASALSGIVGLPLSGAIMQYLDGAAFLFPQWRLAGWQWLFVLEGLPSILMGFVVLLYLTDRPEQAEWLTPAERDWLAGRMRLEERHREAHHGLTLLQALSNRHVWLLCLIYFTVAMGSNSFGVYQPTIIHNHFADRSAFQIGLLGAVPNLVAMISMVIMGVHSDRTGERRWHVALAALVAAGGWTIVALAASPWLALFGLALAQSGMMSMLAPFWSLPTSFLSGAAAAGGIALINSVGNLGGFVGPVVIGKVEATTGGVAGALLVLAGALVVGGLLALGARHDRALEEHGEPRTS